MKHLVFYFSICSLLFIAGSCDFIQSTSTNKGKTLTDHLLAGTSWELVSFNEGEIASTNTGSTKLSLLMETDSTFKGKSYGGNVFNGSYKVFDNNFIETSDSVISTFKMEPEGSKYFEFLDAVCLSNSYHVSNDSLTLFYSEDKSMIFYRKEN